MWSGADCRYLRDVPGGIRPIGFSRSLIVIHHFGKDAVSEAIPTPPFRVARRTVADDDLERFALFLPAPRARSGFYAPEFYIQHGRPLFLAVTTESQFASNRHGRNSLALLYFSSRQCGKAVGCYLQNRPLPAG